MKKILKKSLALLVVLSMILSVTSVVMAAETDFISSHVVFITQVNDVVDETTNEVTGTYTSIRAEAFVRNYASQPGDAILCCCVYDSNGKFVDVSTKAGVNGVLKSDWIVLGDGQTAKAFVWEKDSMKIISKIATYGANEFGDDVSLEITFDGVPFGTYIGYDFDWNTETYTKELAVTDGILSYPHVTAKLTGKVDNTASVKVINDFETGKKTEIIVEMGQRRIKEERTFTPTTDVPNPITGYVYEKPVTKTFTINYTEPTDVMFPVVGDYFYTPIGLTYKVSRTYELPAGAETGDVSFTFTNGYNQRNIFIVKPTDPTADKNVIVNSDGSALTWEDFKLWGSTAYYTGNGVVGQASSTSPVTLGTSTLKVFPETMNSDHNYVTGTMLINDRNPLSGAMHIYSLPEEYIGYNYIPLATGTTTGTISFKVNTSVEVVCFSGNAVTMTDSAGTATAATATEYPLIRWSTMYSSLTQPFEDYLKDMGVIDDGDIASYSTSTTKYPTWDALENKINPYMLKTFGVTYRTVKVSTGDADWSADKEWVADYDNSDIKIIKNLTLGEKLDINNWKIEPRIFTSDINLYTDRNGWADNTADNALGGVVSYPESMELEGAEVIAWSVYFHQATATKEAMQEAGNIMCSFVAGCDAELICTGRDSLVGYEEDGWTRIEAPSENLSMASHTAVAGNHWVWYIKKVNKGEEVVMKTPGIANFPIILARPIN